MSLLRIIKVFSPKSVNYLFFKLYKFYFSNIVDIPKQLYYYFFDSRQISNDIKINSHLDGLNLKNIKFDNNVFEYKNFMNLNRTFDLLGSGWVQNYYDSTSIGFQNFKYDDNLKLFSENLLKSIVPKYYYKKSAFIFNHIYHEQNMPSYELYKPIDWQRDFKSGYRFSSKKWYKSQRKNIPPGVDIKVPWELSRLQHLPQMAIFATINKNFRKKNILEFKNQTLDFISTNPVRFGVNWHCTMDVAIRCVNLLLAYDLIVSIDDTKILDDSFNDIFSSSMYEHMIFIRNNLEWNMGKTNNHYLSNIAGLVFLSSYLYSHNEEIDKNIIDIYNFSKRQFYLEVQKQFNKDGGNFENSSTYHALSSEIVLWVAAILNNNGEFDQKNSLNEKFEEQLGCIYLFSKNILFKNGDLPQFGDNDSGKFVNLTLNGYWKKYEKIKDNYINLSNYKPPSSSIDKFLKTNRWWDENSLNRKTLISMFQKTFNVKKDLFDETFESKIVEKFINKPLSIKCSKPKINIKKTENDLATFVKKTRIESPIKADLRKGLEFKIFQESGYYIFKSKFIFMCIFCGNYNKSTSFGHSHNDRLSVELFVEPGFHLLKDPGTFIYTPEIKMRNQFRDVSVHNTVNFKKNGKIVKMLDWLPGVKGAFSAYGDVHCRLVEYKKLKSGHDSDLLKSTSITLECYYKEFIHQRKVEILSDHIKITDKSNHKFDFKINDYQHYSNGYGKLMKN